MKEPLHAVLWCAVLTSTACCEPQATPTTIGDGESSPSTTLALAQSELPVPSKLEDVLIGEGTSGNLGLTLAFRIRRSEDDAGKNYREAVAHCQSLGRMLCTETQWIRACEEVPALGKMQSWTASRRADRVVVMGGSSCGSKSRVHETNKEPNRVALCCERAVAVRPTRDAGPYLGVGARYPIRLETALNEGDEAALRDLFANQVIRNGRTLSLDELIAQERETGDQIGWTLFDFCEMRGGPVIVAKDDHKTGRVHGILLSCRTLIDRRGEVIDYTTRLGLVQRGDEETYRVAQIDHRGTAVIPGAR